MKEYSTTYFTFKRSSGGLHHQPGYTAIRPNDGTSQDKWELVNTTAAVHPDDTRFVTVFWTWQREEWWEPKGQVTKGDR